MRCREVRFLQEAARLGPLHVLLWSDDVCHAVMGEAPKFPQAERRYYLEAVRYVTAVHVVGKVPDPDALPTVAGALPSAWAVPQALDIAAKRAFCAERGIAYHVLRDGQLAGYPDGKVAPSAPASDRKKVLVTGCYDWFHTGHIRFFEECSGLGDLYVVVGHDANIRLLKGEGHPMFDQDERRYIVGSIRYVTQALISTGHGWLDAEPEIEQLEPDIYAVNEDGDKPEKRQYCAQHSIEYVVLKREPKPGLPRRESTHLRGF
jgi:cytidyltransferase-like protein